MASACIIARLFLACVIFFTLVVGQCYDTTGMLVDISDYAPCNVIKAGGSAACCALNRTLGPGDNKPGVTQPTRDICLPNGLCQNYRRNSRGGIDHSFFRAFCHNKNWTGCLDVAVPHSSYRTPDDIVELTPCDDTWNTTRWCFGTNANHCCSNWNEHRDAISIPLRVREDIAPSSSMSTLIWATTTFPSATASTSLPLNTAPSLADSNGPTRGHSLSAGAIVGIAIGCLIALANVVIIWYFIIAFRRRKTSNPYRKKRWSEEKPPLPEAEYAGGSHIVGNHDTPGEISVSRPADTYTVKSEPGS